MEISRFDVFPRLGWVSQPTPITELSVIAEKYGASWIGCKRDDLCNGLFGGSKVRKLDFLLADSFFQEKPAWMSAGAIGSGHLVACAAAARSFQKKFYAHFFFEPISQEILENLAFIADHAKKVYFYRSRTAMLLRQPMLLLRKQVKDSAFIPVGSNSALGMLGIVRAGVELAMQIRDGQLPLPDRIYVAAGTCGTVAGLSLGLALSGLNTSIRAVATVERIIATHWRISSLFEETRSFLVKYGFHEAKKVKPVQIFLDRKQLGAGYAQPTVKAFAAIKNLQETGVFLDPVYTGKMAAAVFDDLQNGFNGKILLWNSRRSSLPPAQGCWREKLPMSLQKMLSLHF